MFLGEDDSSGGDSETGVDARQTYRLDFTGIMGATPTTPTTPIRAVATDTDRREQLPATHGWTVTHASSSLLARRAPAGFREAFVLVGVTGIEPVTSGV